MFASFTFMGTMATTILNDIMSEKSFQQGGLREIETDGYGYVHGANMVVITIQVFATIMCALKVIHVPQQKLTSTYVWETHEAIFLMIAAGINSNLLVEKFFESKFFVSVYADVDPDSPFSFMDDEQFHQIMRDVMVYLRFIFAGIAWAFIVFNLTVKGTNQYKTQHPRGLELISLAAVSAIFLVQGIYSVMHISELNPESLKRRFATDTPEIINGRHMEFVSENVSELSLAMIGFILTWYSPKNDDTANQLAATEVFNTMFLGTYGAMAAIRSAFALHILEGDVNTAWVPLMFYVLGATVSVGARVMENRTNLRQVASEQTVLFYRAVGQNYTLIGFLWKLSLALGIAAMLIATFSTQAQWFVFKFEAGKIPKNVAHVTGDILGTVTKYGEDAFQVIDKLNPCTWTPLSHPEVNDGKIEYGDSHLPFGPRPHPEKSSFTMSDTDASKLQCSCKGGSSDCTNCQYIDSIKSKITSDDGLRTQKGKLDEQMRRELNGMDGDFKKWDRETKYHEHLKKCHTIECDVVMGIAIAAETAIFASDVVAFLPFVGGITKDLIDGGAWVAQQANRVAHNIITYGLRLSKVLTGLREKLDALEPLVTLLGRLQKEVFKARYEMSFDILVVYLPLFVNGALCFLIAFWRRENVHKLFQTYRVIVTFYLPLTLLNASMFGLMSIFPAVVDDIVRAVPKELFTVTPEEHVGFSLLRKAYMMSTIASFLLFVSTLLDDAYHIRNKAGILRRAMKEVATQKPAKTDAGPVELNTSYVDVGWLQAASITMIVPILFVLSYSYDWRFVDIQFGPAGPLLKVVNSFHSHASMLSDNGAHQDFVEENSLCGLIGKLVGKAISFAIKELDIFADVVGKQLAVFAESILHFGKIISSFEKVGTTGISVLTEVWAFAERILVLIIPMIASFLITVTAFILPRIDNEGAREEVEKTVKQLVMVGLYYNVSLLVMMTQLFATVSNVDLHVFYFKMNVGTLVPVGYICTFVNAVALFAIFVNSIYKAES